MYSLTGFSEKTIHQRLKNLQKVKHKGDWRRSKRIRVHFKVCKIIWEKKIGEEDTDVYTITTSVQTGMIALMRKLQEVAGRSYESVPLAVREYFELSKENFNSKLFNAETVFENDEHYDYFYHLYCRFCEKSCLKTIWGKYSDKLPEEKSIRNLMLK